MRNTYEKSPERVPSIEEVIGEIRKYAEHASFVHEKSDEKGLYLLLMRTESDEKGEYKEYEYMRKGQYSDGNATLTTHIDVTFFDADSIPSGGFNISEYNEESGEWSDNR